MLLCLSQSININLGKSNYLFIFFLIIFSLFSEQKLLANNSVQEPNLQILTKIESKNQEVLSLDFWLEIVRQNQETLLPQELALIESKIASIFFQAGEYGEAVSYWQSANKIYRTKLARSYGEQSSPGSLANQQSKPPIRLEFDSSRHVAVHSALLAANLSDLAQAYLGLGETLLAEETLSEAISIAQSEKLNHILYSSYLTLGNIEKIRGNYVEAEINLNNSLKYASSPTEKIAVNLNLSHIFGFQAQKILRRIENVDEEFDNNKEIKNQAISYQNKAWSNAKKVISEKIESLVTVDAYLQLLKLGQPVLRTGFPPQVTGGQPVLAYLNKAEIILANLPNSTRKVYALINLSEFKQNPVPTLMEAVKIADRLKDNRSSSFALGRLGRYYLNQKQYTEALKWTNRAILTSPKTEADKSLYQWHWQKGRIYTALDHAVPAYADRALRATEGDRPETAISAYNAAISSLQKIRTELARSTTEQIDFSREIEPVYRELLQLLLNNPTPENIEQALFIRDLLQLSELENFFGDDCLELLPEEEKLLSHKTGLIYTIILPTATHVIFKQGQQITSVKIDISQSQLEKLVREWRYSLEDRTEESYLSLSRKMYDLLLEPINLSLNKPDTLIFINDGILKNVPMAALHDGQKFLIEDYSLSTSLSLNLRIRDDRTFTSKTQILAFGLSEETQEFSALPYVEQEIQSINELVKVKQFFNTEFVVNKVEKELVNNNYPIVHFATHGQFNGTLEDSFLETYQGKIDLTNLENILNAHQINFPDNPINLLVLSACETAASNNRSTLGMAGIAIRSGVGAALGSLWYVSDRASAYLIENFYNGLIENEISPAEALRQAQINMIGDPNFHPAVWSNLILIDS